MALEQISVTACPTCGGLAQCVAGEPPTWRAVKPLLFSSTERPTEAGFYWRRFRAGERPEVCEIVKNGKGDLYVCFTGQTSRDLYPLADVEGEWAGPLACPWDGPIIDTPAEVPAGV